MMGNLVNDLLDLAKLDNHKFSLNNEFFNLSSTVYEALHMLRFSANEIGVNLVAEID